MPPRRPRRPLPGARTVGEGRLAAAPLPDQAGEQPRVLLTVTAGALHDTPDTPGAVLDGYGPVGNDTARQVCCDAEVTAVAHTDGRDMLCVGRDRRQPNRAQRRAVFARDQGCVGCGAPLSLCQIHHVLWPWHERGRTDITVLVAACWDCHDKIHHCGWQVHRRADGSYTIRPPDHPPGPDQAPQRRGATGRPSLPDPTPPPRPAPGHPTPRLRPAPGHPTQRPRRAPSNSNSRSWPPTPDNPSDRHPPVATGGWSGRARRGAQPA